MYYKRRYTPRRRYYKKKTYAKRTAKLSKPMRKAVKQVVFKAIETKWNYHNAGSVAPLIFDANSPYSVNLLSSITQGDGQQNRTGDRLNVANITFSGNVQAVPGATVHFNIFIFRSAIYRQGSAEFTGTNIAYSAFFKPVTNDSDIDIPDHEKVTVLKHRRITLEPLNVTNGLKTVKFCLRVDMKKAAYQYDNEAGNLGKTNNIYGMVIADNDQQSQISNAMIVVRFKDA